MCGKEYLFLCISFALILPHSWLGVVEATSVDEGRCPDYANMVIRWGKTTCSNELSHKYSRPRCIAERRTLYCEASTNGLFSGKCFLTKGGSDGAEPQHAHCHEELHEDKESGVRGYRSYCDIECVGADRDSVISKFPSSSRECTRFHTYNTLNRRKEGEKESADKTPSRSWFLWRSKQCRLMEISLEVHCGFP